MRRKGQTLLEVVVAIGVVAVALSAMVLTTTVGIRTARVARERSRARQLAEEKLEQVRGDRDVDPDGFFGLGSRQEGPTLIGTNPQYSLTTTYTDVVAGAQVEVKAEVTWEDSGRTYTSDQTTYLAKWQ